MITLPGSSRAADAESGIAATATKHAGRGADDLMSLLRTWREMTVATHETFPRIVVPMRLVHRSLPKSARTREYEAPWFAAHRQHRHAQAETYLGKFGANPLGSNGIIAIVVGTDQPSSDRNRLSCSECPHGVKLQAWRISTERAR